MVQGGHHPLRVHHFSSLNDTPENIRFQAKINDKPAVMMGLIPTESGNPLVMSKSVRAHLKALMAQHQGALSIRVFWDASRFIHASLLEVGLTIGIAFMLS